MSVTATQLLVKLQSQGVNQVKNELKGAGDAADATGLSFKAIAGGALLGAGAALVGIGIKAIGMAGVFQLSMTQLVTGAGESQSILNMVSDGILQMARDTGQPTKDLADGMYLIESAGFHGAAALDVLKASAEGAKVGNASLADVANGVTTEMTDYASKNYSASQATNILIATVAQGKVHLGDLANALSAVLPSASAAGVGLVDVQAAMATMTGEGVPAADAATYLRQTIMALEAPSKQTVKGLADVGLTSKQVADEMKVSLPDTLAMITDAVGKKFPVGSAGYVAALKDIAGGSKQMQGILDLTGDHLQTLQNNYKTISQAAKDNSGSITGWKEVQGDFNTQMDRAKEVAETYMIELGQKLLPAATQLMNFFANNAVPTVNNVENAFHTAQTKISDLTSFITSHQDVLAALKAAMIGIGAAITISAVPAIISSVIEFGAQTVAAGAAAVATIAATLPFIALAAAIGAAVFVGIEIYNHWGQITAFARDHFGPEIKALGTGFSDFGSFVRGVVTDVQNLFSWLGQLADKAGAALNSLKNIPGVGGLLSSIPGFAEGTNYAPGGLALVGEKGPELVRLPGGSQVFPTSSVFGGTGGGSSNMSQTIVIQLDGRTISQSVVRHLPTVIRAATGVSM